MKLLNNPLEIILKGEKLVLIPEKAVYYPKEKSLIIADIHLGKTGHFRNAGIPVPAELAYADLTELDCLLSDKRFEINILTVLGDFFHERENFDLRIFENWRERNHNIKIQLIKGNHDILSEKIYSSLGIETYNLKIVNKFLFIHDCNDEEQIKGLYKISGHIHPGVRVYGKAKQSLTLPCFYFGREFSILPAFGKFTGLQLVYPKESDSVFVVPKNSEQ